MTNWETRSLGEICRDGGGFIRTGPFGSQLHQSDYTDDPAGIPVVMPKDMNGGRIDRTSISRIDAATSNRLSQHLLAANDVVLSRRGDVSRSAWVSEHDLPAFCGTGSMRIHPGEPTFVRPQYLRFFFRSPLASDYLEAHAVGATMPNLNASIVEGLPVPILPLGNQDAAVAVLAALDDLIENNRRRTEVLEEMARAIYREWFVRFRYPGHENARLVESALGPVPQGWRVQSVAAIASKQRHAVTSGPFGSKLGRKDYRDEGVPVLRGANLRVGGGFDETDLVYVSEEKANELRSSLTGPDDIVITQRGTLGQVGIIPSRPRFERYVLSQSQMKITTDAEVAAPGFVYAQMRSKSTTRRFVAQAITAGVPHVNLALLRDFQIVVPPIAVQRMFTDTADPLWASALALASQRLSLVALRDLLLPKLVMGEIDIPSLDLNVLVEGAVA